MLKDDKKVTLKEGQKFTLTTRDIVGDDTIDMKSEKYRRFVSEHDYMKDKWGYLLYSDRFYNPNLSLKKAFVLDKK